MQTLRRCFSCHYMDCDDNLDYVCGNPQSIRYKLPTSDGYTCSLWRRITDDEEEKDGGQREQG